MGVLIEFGRGDSKLAVRAEEIAGVARSGETTLVHLKGSGGGKGVQVNEAYETARAKLLTYVEGNANHNTKE